MYVCTECSSRHTTEAKAAKCHWGIGGVMTEAEWQEELERFRALGVDVTMWA